MTHSSDPAPPGPAAAMARAKVLPARLPPTPSPPELVPARMVNEVLYCERLMYLEWVQGEFEDNAFTVEGRAVHRRADRSGRPLKERRKTSSEESAPTAPASQAPAEEPADPERPYTSRSVWLSSERLGLTAKIDVVEADKAQATPIEYKRGKKPDLPEGAYLPERAQLCAQVLLLREHGFECTEASIYYAADHRRVSICIDEELVQTTIDAIARVRELGGSSALPPALIDSPKCNGCSLVGICLPDETNLLSPTTAEALDSAKPPAEEPELRRLHPARDDRVPLYVQQNGGRISLDGERLRVTRRDEEPLEARLVNTSQVALLGNVQITVQAIKTLLSRGIPVSFFTYGGWFLGGTYSTYSKNIDLRLAQYAAASDPDICLALARGLVVAKVLNCRTLLRRNHREDPAVALGELKQAARKAATAPALDSLLGIEGTAARAYFGAFTGMIKPEARSSDFDLQGRNRRPPRDPVNALLSFCYALLTKDFVVTLNAVGLDPLLGFYHQPRFGRPALALDLMEEFRPLVADSVVLSAINTEVVTAADFIRSAGGVALRPAARRRLILAYERRMDQLVTHPLFGYRISYRRVLEVQARLLSRLLLGEMTDYPSFRTR